jgi:hypothetical protein
VCARSTAHGSRQFGARRARTAADRAIRLAPCDGSILRKSLGPEGVCWSRRERRGKTPPDLPRQSALFWAWGKQCLPEGGAFGCRVLQTCWGTVATTSR